MVGRQAVSGTQRLKGFDGSQLHFKMSLFFNFAKTYEVDLLSFNPYAAGC